MSTLTIATSTLSPQKLGSEPKSLPKTKSIRYIGSSSAVSLDYVGTNVWVADEKVIWVQAKVLAQNKNMLTIQKLVANTTSEIDMGFEEVHKANPKIVADMAELLSIHEPGILYNLIQRALRRNPYTYMGTVMIAMNPLTSLPSPATSDYTDKPLNPYTPHPYALAELAYQQLCFSSTDQCLVVSGESGAGKTETAKILLKFIADRSPYASEHITDHFDKRMLQSSPLLESFGNAKTGRNNNSSRFGKLLKMFFKQNSNAQNNKLNALTPSMSNLKDKMGLVGVAIETYLLEKSRVVGMNEGERNYHIFYQLLANIHSYTQTKTKTETQDIANNSVSHLMKERTDPSAYRILNKSTCYTFNGANDANNFQITHDALISFGYTLQDTQAVYSILMALLHMGNITFVDEETSAGEKARIESYAPLEAAADRLGVSTEVLESLLTSRVIGIGGGDKTQVATGGVATIQRMTVRLSAKEANYARDASIKAIYENLFATIVRQINQSLGGNQGDLNQNPELSFISILDIYGFEQFEVNSFEQFLINYANESLQNIFNSQIFESELRLFEEEKIIIKVSSQPENNGCIELISARHQSILSILDSISQLPQPSDERFVDELQKQLSKNRYFPSVHIKEKHNTFCVKHFAGKIKYTVGSTNEVSGMRKNGESCPNWVSKNNDACPDELSTMCNSSTLSVMKMLFSQDNYDKILTSNNNLNNTIKKPNRNLIPSTTAAVLTNIKNNATTSSRTINSNNTLDSKNQILKTTIATNFSNSMFDLSTLLVSCNCLFIRCIKPNMSMQIDKMENSFIVNQLRSLGVLQTCEVLKLGMPTRLPYTEVIQALQPVIAKLPSDLVKKTEPITMVACVLIAFNVQKDLYKLGRSRVFFRAGQFELIERILQSSSSSSSSSSASDTTGTGSGSGSNSNGSGSNSNNNNNNNINGNNNNKNPSMEEVATRIKQATQFKLKVEKMAVELTEVLKSKEHEIHSSRHKVAQAIDLINKATVKRIEVPTDIAEILGNCESLLSIVKTHMNDVTVKGNLAITACKEVINKLDEGANGNIGNELISTITTELSKLNTRVQKVNAKHSSTTIRFDALLGRHERVRDVASSLEEILMSVEGLITKATLKVTEIDDGAMRIDVAYADEKAKSCGDLIQQISFKLEGVSLDLKEIFDVFGGEGSKGGVEVGFRLVKAQFASELKTLQDVKKELDLCLLTCEDALELAESVKDDNDNDNDEDINGVDIDMMDAMQLSSQDNLSKAISFESALSTAEPSKVYELHTIANKISSNSDTMVSTSSDTSGSSGRSVTVPAAVEFSSSSKPECDIRESFSSTSSSSADITAAARNKLKQDIDATTKLASQLDLNEATAKLKDKQDEAAKQNILQKKEEGKAKLAALFASKVSVPPPQPPIAIVIPSSSSSSNSPEKINKDETKSKLAALFGKPSLDLPPPVHRSPRSSPGPGATVHSTSQNHVVNDDTKLKLNILFSNKPAGYVSQQPPHLLTEQDQDLVNKALATASRSSPTKDISILRRGSSTNTSPTSDIKKTRPGSLSLTKASASSVVAGYGVDMSSTGTGTELSSIAKGSVIDDALPEGWKEHYDPTTKRPFYVHKATKARQWRRPTMSSPEPVRRKSQAMRRPSLRSDASSSISEDDPLSSLETPVTLTSTSNHSVASYLKPASLLPTSPTGGDLDRNTIVNMLRADLGNNSLLRSRTSAMNRSLSKSISNHTTVQQPADNTKQATEIKRINLEIANKNNILSVSKMEYIGLENKSGYLMKKSSILGRWRKRWFVLENGRFEYFDRPQDESSGNGKSFLLTPESLTSNTSSENCFCVKSNEESDEGSHWYLVARDEEEMESWMVALNSHIHVMFAMENAKITGVPRSDLWEDGIVETSFWRVVKASSTGQPRSNLAIRTLPKTNGPRTSEEVKPNEIYEFIQTLKADFNTYLRLSADRGWLYEKHPKARYEVLERVQGEYIEISQKLKFIGAGKCPVYSGPSYDNTLLTLEANSQISNNETFTSIASFQQKLPNGRVASCEFYKLSSGLGWVPRQNKAGAEILKFVA